MEAFRLAFAEFKPSIDAVLIRHTPLTPTSAQEAANEITGLLAGLTLPLEIASALRDALPEVCADATPLAVRSSAIDEDRPDISFAGQYSSVIGVLGQEAIYLAVLTCWRSFFGANALLERATHLGSCVSDGMAVLIQPVIQAECAGVCFSVDPVRRQGGYVIVDMQSLPELPRLLRPSNAMPPVMAPSPITATTRRPVPAADASAVASPWA